MRDASSTAPPLSLVVESVQESAVSPALMDQRTNDTPTPDDDLSMLVSTLKLLAVSIQSTDATDTAGLTARKSSHRDVNKIDGIPSGHDHSDCGSSVSQGLPTDLYPSGGYRCTTLPLPLRTASEAMLSELATKTWSFSATSDNDISGGGSRSLGTTGVSLSWNPGVLQGSSTHGPNSHGSFKDSPRDDVKYSSLHLREGSFDTELCKSNSSLCVTEDHLTLPFSNNDLCCPQYSSFLDTCSSGLFDLSEPLFQTSPPILMNALLESGLIAAATTPSASSGMDINTAFSPSISSRCDVAADECSTAGRQSFVTPRLCLPHRPVSVPGTPPPIHPWPSPTTLFPYQTSPNGQTAKDHSEKNEGSVSYDLVPPQKQQTLLSTPPPLPWLEKERHPLSTEEDQQPRLQLKLNRHGRCGDGPTFWGMWEDERSRMVYVSWLPRAARAGDRSEKKKCELALKDFITRALGFSGLQKVLLFPPSSAHCKLLFASEHFAMHFLSTFGGMEGDAGPTLWKSLVCQYFSVNIRGGIHATRVRIIWADQTKNEPTAAAATAGDQQNVS